MKLGTESRWKTIIALALFCVAVYVVVSGFTSPSVPPPPTNPNRQGMVDGTPPPRRSAARQVAVLTQSIDPRLRLDLLNLSQSTKYEGRGRNIFDVGSEPKPETELPKIKIIPQQVTAPVNPGPPPINMKFFGFASRPGEAKRVFLSQNGDIFVASEGEIVNRRYRVVRINPTSVEIEDVLNNNRQSIPLQQG